MGATMKRILITAIILLAWAPAWAGSTTVVVGQGSAAPAGCTENCEDYTAICENMEGTGTATGWTDTVGAGGTVDWDDTTATVLRDMQQLELTRDGADVYTRHTLDAADSYWVHFRVKAADGTPSAAVTFIYLNNAGTGAGTYLIWRTDGNIRAFHGTSYYTTTTTPISGDNTLYHVWVYYSKATSGNNGVYKVWVGSTGDRDTASLEVDKADGQCTYQITRVQPACMVANGSIFIDQLYVSTTEIGDVCD
jgi:hypothetical protein